MTPDQLNPIKGLSKSAAAVCKRNRWNRGWREAGCCLHLEVSEFIEALRGKRSTVEEEAGDILFVLLSTLHDNRISIDEVFDCLQKKIETIKAKEPYNVGT